MRDEELTSVQNVGRRLGLRDGTVRLWIRKRWLPAVKLNRQWRVPVSAVERLIAEGTRKSAETSSR